MNVLAAPGATVNELELIVPVTPLILIGEAVKVYVPEVLTTRLENVATPFVTFTVEVPDVNPDCGLPVLIVTVTDPVAVVTTFPRLSSTCTATLGIAMPAVPGPGVVGLNTSCVAGAGETTKELLNAGVRGRLVTLFTSVSVAVSV